MIKGVSGKHTLQKQDIFSKFVEWHITIVKQIYDKYGGQRYDYLYFDPFAGPGHILDTDYDGSGSPRIFNNIMSSYETIKYRMVVSESDPVRRVTLADCLSTENAPFELKDNALECCPKNILKDHYGMVYIDPPMSKESFSILKQIMKDFSVVCPKVDIVLHIGANFVKRFFYASHVTFKDRLTDLIGYENKELKEDWVIKQSYGGQNQYTFLVGANFIDWAEWGKFEFFNIESPRGWQILTRLNYKEHDPLFETYKMKQGRMF